MCCLATVASAGLPYAVSASPAVTRSAPTTPTGTYQALLTAALTMAGLPPGFIRPAKPEIVALPSFFKEHGAVGGLLYAFSGPGNAEMNYVVFKTHQGAVAVYNDQLKRPGVKFSPAPTSFPRPANTSNGTLPAGSGHAKGGLTDIEWVDGTVLVSALTISFISTTHGNSGATLKLAQYARNQLRAIAGTG